MGAGGQREGETGDKGGGGRVGTGGRRRRAIRREEMGTHRGRDPVTRSEAQSD